MRKPTESLNDYNVSHAPEVAPEPPREVSLQRTGEIEVLKPLAHPEANVTAFKVHRRSQPLWFRRFLVVGSGALVFIAMVLVSSILVGLSDANPGSDVARSGTPGNPLAQPEEPYTFDLSSPSTFDPATDLLEIVRSSVRRIPSRPIVHRVYRKPRPHLRPVLRAEHPKFVPTTLVIYAKNGVINTRIEPWIQSGDKKSPTVNN